MFQEHEANLTTPIWLAHGEDDPIVQYRYGLMTYEKLLELGYNPSSDPTRWAIQRATMSCPTWGTSAGSDCRGCDCQWRGRGSGLDSGFVFYVWLAGRVSGIKSSSDAGWCWGLLSAVTVVVCLCLPIVFVA